MFQHFTSPPTVSYPLFFNTSYFWIKKDDFVFVFYKDNRMDCIAFFFFFFFKLIALWGPNLMHSHFIDISKKTTGVRGKQQWGNTTQWLRGSTSANWHMNFNQQKQSALQKRTKRNLLTRSQKKKNTLDRCFDPWTVPKCQSEWAASRYWEKYFGVFLFVCFGFFCFFLLPTHYHSSSTSHRIAVTV